jgi:hypothetical protein
VVVHISNSSTQEAKASDYKSEAGLSQITRPHLKKRKRKTKKQQQKRKKYQLIYASTHRVAEEEINQYQLNFYKYSKKYFESLYKIMLTSV